MERFNEFGTFEFQFINQDLFVPKMFRIGQIVRVSSEDGANSKRGTIMVGNGDDTYDILFQVAGVEDVEEYSVPSSRIQELFYFENMSFDYTPEKCKECGNELFQAKDFSCANDMYGMGVKLLEPDQITVGQTVIIFNATGLDAMIGMISDVEDGTCDIFVMKIRMKS